MKGTSPGGIVKSIHPTGTTVTAAANGTFGARIPWRLRYVRPITAANFFPESANGADHVPLLTVAGDRYDLFPQIGTNDPAEVCNC
jgi:hypothetical protein